MPTRRSISFAAMKMEAGRCRAPGCWCPSLRIVGSSPDRRKPDESLEDGAAAVQCGTDRHRPTCHARGAKNRYRGGPTMKGPQVAAAVLDDQQHGSAVVTCPMCHTPTSLTQSDIAARA